MTTKPERRFQFLGISPAPTHVKICFSCIFRAPIHVLSCSHRLCDSCLREHGDGEASMSYKIAQCPFCRVANGRPVHVQPPVARPRVLVLRSLSILSAVCFLRDLRARLFGPTHEYLDMVVGVNKGLCMCMRA